VNTEQLLIALDQVNHTKASRQLFANQMMTDPEDISLLIEVSFDNHKKECLKAAWVLEVICQKELQLLLPHLGVFTSQLPTVSHPSAKRPMAKICDMITKDYYLNPHSKLRDTLTDAHKKAISETCFDWLISKEKVAVKVFAMSTLHLLGLEYTWIHPELRSVLEKNFTAESAGYQARARQLLKRLKL